MTIPIVAFAIAIYVVSTEEENSGKSKHPKPKVPECLFSYSCNRSWYEKA